MTPWRAAGGQRGPGGRLRARGGGAAAALQARPFAHSRRRQTERARPLPCARASAQPRHVAAAPAPRARGARGDWAASGSGTSLTRPARSPRPAAGFGQFLRALWALASGVEP